MNEKRETETASSTTTATHFYRYAVMASDNINIKYIYIYSVLRYMYVWRGVFICGSQKVFPFHTHSHSERDADDCFRRRFVLAISSHMLSNDLNKEIPICLIYALWLKHTHIRTLSIGTIFRSYFASTQNPFFSFRIFFVFVSLYPLSFIIRHFCFSFCRIFSLVTFSFSMQ